MKGLKKLRRQWRTLRLQVRRRQVSSLSPLERRIRWGLDMARLAAIRMRRNRAGFIAAALSFRLLFSLIPLLALAAVVARYSVSEEAFLSTVDTFINQTGLEDVSVAAAGSDGEVHGLGEWMRAQAKAAMGINPASLGVLGALFLAWSALRLFDEIEAAFSSMTGGTRRRSRPRRALTALGLLVLLPAAGTIGMELLDSVFDLLPSVLGGVLHVLLFLVVITGLVAMVYRWYPHCGPPWRASLSGAAFAAVAALIGQWVLLTYVFKAVPSSPLGGALGLVPLVMLWVYVMWLCLLYGLELAILIDRGRARWRSAVVDR